MARCRTWARTRSARPWARLHGWRPTPFQVAPHPLLGGPTLAVTSIRAGENVNSIPDTCTFTLDVRTIPGMDHAEVLTELKAVLGPAVHLDVPLADMAPVGTDPEDPFVQCVLAC